MDKNANSDWRLKTATHSTQAWAVVLTAALLLTSVTEAFAKNAITFTRDSPMPPRKGRTLGAFNNNNAEGWSWVSAKCTTIDVTCAQAAVLEASTECGQSAKFFKKGSQTWQWIGFALIMVSAASTAVGASATVSNSKIWSTLGGTTGLGAVTTTVNSNATSDQNAVVAVNATLDSLNKAVTAAGKQYEEIYLTASIYAAKCAAIANSSSGTTPPQSVQASKPGAPVIGTASPGNGQVSVAFTAPNNDGSAITSYTVLASPGGATATGIASPITVTNLTNDTSYTFTVTATNSAGSSPASAASAPVKPHN